MTLRLERPSIDINDLLNVENGMSPLITHDLCSALSDVLSGLELVELDRLDSDNLVQIERAQVSGQTLARLIESLIKDLQGAGGALGTDENKIETEKFLARLEKRWSPRAAEKGLTFEVEIQTAVPETVGLDNTALERILANILENAINYSDTGKIRLNIGLGDENDLTFVVRDSGSGFSKAALEQLFEFGGRPDDSAAKGSGLGLHISSRLIEQMNGEISVFNSSSGGVVAITFPESSWKRDNQKDLDIRSADLSGLKVLLAEDNQTNQILLNRFLTSLKAEVTLAVNGIDALDHLESAQFDLALLDIEMPFKNGIEVIKAIRKRRDAKAQMPLIAISAFSMSQDFERIQAAGADGTITKPVLDAQKFGREVLKILSKANQRVDAAESISLQGFEHSILDQATYQKLIHAVGAEAFPDLIVRVHEDLLAVLTELEKATDRLNYMSIRSQTHILISVAGAIGAKSVQAQAQILNAFANEKADTEVRKSSLDCISALKTLVSEISFRSEKMGEGGR